MGSLIDSGIFIAAERNRIDLDGLVAEFPGEPIVIAAVTAAELLHGVHRANDPVRQAARSAAVERVLNRFRVVEFDLPVARVYAQLVAERAAAGRPLASDDLMVAATALVRGYRIITRDAKSFPQIPGLDVVLR